MPRIDKALIRKANRIHRFLPLVLREVRELDSARAELRWLGEHVRDLVKQAPSSRPLKVPEANALLHRLCRQRSQGKPLQYILGSHPFGGVNIICRPGVLCPRSETEETVQSLSELLKVNTTGRLNIIDLCTGPGSIALLLAQNLPKSRILGIDNSGLALRIANQSIKLNIREGNLRRDAGVSFILGDVIQNTEEVVGRIRSHFSQGSSPSGSMGTAVDVIVANPPYISAEALWKDTTRSVRLFEPRVALTPPKEVPSSNSLHHEDLFYPAIEKIASKVLAKAIIAEVGCAKQAQRVKNNWESQRWKAVIWKDYAGLDRNVVAWRKGFGDWSWLERKDI